MCFFQSSGSLRAISSQHRAFASEKAPTEACHVQRRQLGDALAHLLQAEATAPDMVRTHIAARGAISELVVMAGRSVSPELRGLAERSDAMGMGACAYWVE